ncbi:UV-stimulated scaffold protein A isoform X2 [Salarias fasciatus]|uniref:UV-stimulated scaffold protein A isoform X2 n=1 Tax=Salarias fasciatus TaxID=181472 RepID=UPI001176C40D|nr:UV-stimulated scaffold protein A isoform X2 [Salarias fasciatus]
MEPSQRERLSQLVEELTTSGRPQLDQDKMKEVKKICKVSTDCVDHVYRSLMSQLNQDHAEIRLSAFQVASELFSRSHHFRTLLVDNFQEFLELTVETDLEQPLPPPKEVSRKLKALSIQTVQSWQAAYGSAYKKLALGYHFLKQVKKVDFQDAEARTVAERRREEDRRSKMERIYRERVEAATKDMEEWQQEIQDTLTEMESCLQLLFPQFSLQLHHSRTTGGPPETGGTTGGPPETGGTTGGPPETGGTTGGPPETGGTTGGPPETGGTTEGPTETGGTTEGPTETGGTTEGPQEPSRAPESPPDQEQPCCSRELRSQEEEEEEEEGEEGEEEEEDEEDEEEEEQPGGDSFIRNSGLVSHSYSLDLNLSPGLHLKETEDNEPVVSTVIDLHRLITTKHLPAVQSWVQLFTRSGADQQLLRRALDLKMSLEAVLQKHQELHIDYKTRVRRVMKAGDDQSEDEDDFDEVPEKEGYEPYIPEHLRAEYGLDPSPSTSTAAVTQKAPPTRPAAAPPPPSSSSSSSSSRRLKRLLEEEQDPTSAVATLRLLRQKLPLPAQAGGSSGPSGSSGSLGPAGSSGPSSSQSSSDQKAVEAPVVPFGLDLYYWGQEQPNAGKIVKAASQHQFWVPSEVEEEVENQDLLAQSKTRYISFPGSFTPVSHSCRAPLGGGKLCPRQDRLKCPFHGPIVPRDQEGRACRPEDRARDEQEQRRRRETQPPDWFDPQLMRDIEAATGEDLGSDRVPGKRGRGKKKKKKYPNLSDLKQSTNTSRSRLERKVFNKSSLRRMAQVMNKVDRRKHDKFSNQFNYALN